MPHEFSFIGPNKIPPRRSVNPNRSGRVPIRRIESQPELEESAEPINSEFDFISDLPNARTVLVNSGINFEPEEGQEESQFDSEELEEETDPLTLAILSGANFSYFSENKKDFFPTPEVNIFSNPSPQNSRSAVFAELEEIEKEDIKLVKNLSRITLPSRQSNRAGIPKINQNSDEFFSAITADSHWANTPEEFVLERDKIRAEEDWFLIKSQPGEYFNIRKNSLGDGNSRSGHKTWLAGLFLFLLPAVLGFFLFSGDSNFVKASIGTFNSKLMSAASFTLVNSEEGSSFPFLVRIRNKLNSQNQIQNAAVSIDKFLEKNSAFSWQDVFRKNFLWADNSMFLEWNLLELARAELLSLEKQYNTETLKNLRLELDQGISWLNFWQNLFQPGKDYLIVLADSENSSPGGGVPVIYTLVRTTDSGLEVVNSGKFSALDAAASSKIIPPQPLQVFSTSWLPTMAGWFLDFGESAKTTLDFFANTTQTQPIGLVVVSKDALKSFSLKESILFNIDSTDWFSGLMQALSRKQPQKWVALSDSLEDLLAAHKIQFYFADKSLQEFVNSSGWINSPVADNKSGSLGVAWVADKPGLKTELIEHNSDVFEDGSIVSKLNISLRQASSDAVSGYYKIYIPRGSQVLKVDGFSARKVSPDFDYSGKGFTKDARLSEIKEFSANKNVDIFEEGGFDVLGGWVSLKSEERKVFSVDYVLPFRIYYKGGDARYQFKVFRPYQPEDIPFRFTVSPQKGVEIISLNPDGFISEGLGEHQSNLARDLRLEAVLRFDR